MTPAEPEAEPQPDDVAAEELESSPEPDPQPEPEPAPPPRPVLPAPNLEDVEDLMVVDDDIAPEEPLPPRD